MTFDHEGHIVVTPAEVEAMLRTDVDRLICTALLPGTPVVFATHDEFCRFRAMVAEELSVHPSSIIFRGSTKIGFSLTPRPERAWLEMAADSDVDLAVVDPDHFHFLDAEVRRWERNPAMKAQGFRGQGYFRSIRLRENRAFYCYKYMDLPDTSLVQKYQAAMDKASSPQSPGCNRQVTAFFFRDWWSLHSRYEYDLRQLLHALRQPGFPAADRQPRTRDGLTAL
jgi:hypothetical protein